jgi:hypothetical protein
MPPRQLCPAMLFFKFNEEIKTLHNKHKLNQFIFMKFALQKIMQTIEEEERQS